MRVQRILLFLSKVNEKLFKCETIGKKIILQNVKEKESICRTIFDSQPTFGRPLCVTLNCSFSEDIKLFLQLKKNEDPVYEYNFFNGINTSKIYENSPWFSFINQKKSQRNSVCFNEIVLNMSNIFEWAYGNNIVNGHPYSNTIPLNLSILALPEKPPELISWSDASLGYIFLCYIDRVYPEPTIKWTSANYTETLISATNISVHHGFYYLSSFLYLSSDKATVTCQLTIGLLYNKSLTTEVNGSSSLNIIVQSVIGALFGGLFFGAVIFLIIYLIYRKCRKNNKMTRQESTYRSYTTGEENVPLEESSGVRKDCIPKIMITDYSEDTYNSKTQNEIDVSFNSESAYV